MAIKSGKKWSPKSVIEARTLRLTETIAPFGPGAIVDILGESFMAPTGEAWPPPHQLPAVDCPRLVEKLGIDGRKVEELRSAPSYDDQEKDGRRALEFTRFPAWMFCDRCSLMHRWKVTDNTKAGSAPSCPDCDGRLVPMRFVLLCTTRGHAEDVPWDRWSHRPAEVCASPKLRFVTSGRGAGLSALQVVCDCGRSRSLGELNKNTLARDGFNCSGRQPWERGRVETRCAEPLDAQQRGATNVRFGDVVSAIDIPWVASRAETASDSIQSHLMHDALLAAQAPLKINQIAQFIADDLDVSVETVLAARTGTTAFDHARISRSILDEEFEAFNAARQGSASTSDFVTRIDEITGAGEVGEVLTRTFDGVVIVDRLREVRASIGFRRYKPDAALVPSVPRSEIFKSWLPAVENYGEGVFIRFESAPIDEWAGRRSSADRYGMLQRNRDDSNLRSRLAAATPQFLMLHSFAHVLMARLAHTAGYTAPALRERVYAAQGDYGVLVYTTTGGTAGTLGGLAREGERDRLPESIVNALTSMSWCANDPVCAESSPQSIDGLNLAACHSCLMAPETSCESMNLLLDRNSLVGKNGFFEPLVTAAQAAAIAGAR
ncbi:hypothetical protein EDF54_2491 [Rathayibacter sp. PhB93]|uniref:DrmB family protein n=1 Tax=unclassified Rathayibacter TaxID=2609250 RepID=UPI000F472AC9|nr:MULTISPECIES: DrmB family protein [unclassified Rathayibacter]MCJ1671846.1 DrmB family protein [Rathayibacter sp. VKM Ac-2929]ROQ04288.1 hypothetical protein EDF54_2491 [Rathayibacter sp. PhB93]TDQ13125.1 hypothetical protein EDF17_1726 [Rathayibacter sp. PhB1]